MASHTIELLEHALDVAKRAHVRVRSEWFDGGAGGLCRVGKQFWLFVDISLPVEDQLVQVAEGLRQLSLGDIEISPELKRLVL